LRLPPLPPSKQSRWKNSRVVQHHQVAGTQEFGKLAKLPVLILATRPIKMQHPRGRTIFEWLLRNQLRRQRIIKVRDQHASDYIGGGNRRGLRCCCLAGISYLRVTPPLPLPSFRIISLGHLGG